MARNEFAIERYYVSFASRVELATRATLQCDDARDTCIVPEPHISWNNQWFGPYPPERRTGMACDDFLYFHHAYTNVGRVALAWVSSSKLIRFREEVFQLL